MKDTVRGTVKTILRAFEGRACPVSATLAEKANVVGTYAALVLEDAGFYLSDADLLSALHDLYPGVAFESE